MSSSANISSVLRASHLWLPLGFHSSIPAASSAATLAAELPTSLVPLHVEYAERRMKYGILWGRPTQQIKKAVLAPYMLNTRSEE